MAQERVRAREGTLILRVEDLDRARCKPEFVTAMLEDLRWFGFEWQAGPDLPDSLGVGPFNQSERMGLYRAALDKLRAGGFLFPCTCSRKDIRLAASAPNAAEDDEPIYPGTCRPQAGNPKSEIRNLKCNWRFRVPDGETISFLDGHFGSQRFVAGKDFGDFVVWSHQGPHELPAYQLACVVDDAAMRISEVVRGADLLKSTARQLLLYRALGLEPPQFFHCPLVTDEAGIRLAKRHDALSLRTLRAGSATPESLRRNWHNP